MPIPEAHDLQHYYGSAESLVAARVPRWLVAEAWKGNGLRESSNLLVHQLRLVVYPIIHRVLYIQNGGWPWGLLPSRI